MTTACSSTSQNGGFWVEDPEFYKKLFLLAMPMVLQNLITFGVIFSDNLMVGRLGESAISGLYMGTLVQTVLQILLFGVESTVLILSTQYWGKRDCNRIKDVISIGMRLSLAGTAVIALTALLFPSQIIGLLTPDAGAIVEGGEYLRAVSVSYLLFCASQLLIVAMRSVEIVRIGLINSITAFCVNVFLNYVLIFGKFGLPALGVAGAAYATDISRAVELAVVLFFVLKIDKNLKLRLRDFLRWDSNIFHDLVKYGTPLLLGQIVWAINNIGQGAIIGQLKAAAISAASIAGMFDRLLWMGTWGVAAATGIMVGKAIGAGDYELVKRYARTMQAIFFGIGIMSALIVFFGRGIFLSFYELEPETLNTAMQFMAVLSVIMIGRCYQAPSLFGLVKAGGDTAFVFKNDTFWVFCWVLPAAWTALKCDAPPWLVFALLLSDQIFKCFVAYVKISRYDWMKNLTRTSTGV
ncbi:MAG: MATE family efflux transporter [Victivallaceae bacterium]|nr:MATE family efflux transporter [Victivallaceae bacterium]